MESLIPSRVLTSTEKARKPRRKGHPIKGYEAPYWLKRIGPYLVSLFLVLVGVGWTLYAPPSSFTSPLYLSLSLATSIITWWWSGQEPIPGRRRAKRGLQGNWLVLIAVLLADLVIGSAAHDLNATASSFSWAFFAAAVKLSFMAIFYQSLRPCPICTTTKWFQKYEGAWYCPRCGTRLQPDVAS